MEFPVFQFVAIVSCPDTEHPWEEPGSVFFTPPSGIDTCGWDPPELSP